jgi:hypothetical protein
LQLFNLRTLDLYGNGLSEIPENIAALTSLVVPESFACPHSALALLSVLCYSSVIRSLWSLVFVFCLLSAYTLFFAVLDLARQCPANAASFDQRTAFAPDNFSTNKSTERRL